MNETFPQAIDTQRRVLWALCLREIHGKHGKTKLGYLWEIIKTGFGLAVFWAIRALARAQTPSGLPMPVFLLMGFTSWYIFSEIISKTMVAVSSNRALLTFPQIFPLDLILASAIVSWVTEVVIMGIFLGLFQAMGYHFQCIDPVTLLAELLGVGFFGLGCGLVLASLNSYLRVIEKLVPMVLRILFFASGVFFSPSQMAPGFGNILMWNPVLNFIELARGTFLYHTPSSDIKILFIACLTVSLMAFGLLLERYTRSRLSLL